MTSIVNDHRKKRGWQHPIVRRAAIFILLFGVWLILSGKFLVEFLVLGAISSALVVYLTSHLLEPSSTEEYQPLPQSFRWLGLTIVRFLVYIPWLIFEIVTANVQVAYQILHPKLPISPQVLVFHTTLDSEPSQIVLAQSITLTPGTITMDLDHGRFVIHALGAAQDQIIGDGGMQERVGKVFDEVTEPITSIRTLDNIDEFEL